MKRGFCLSRGVGLLCFLGLMYAYGGITGPTFDATFSPSQIGPGSISTLTFTINNVTGDPVEDMAFSTTLPAGLLFAPSSIPQTTCQEATLAFDDPINPTTLTFSGGVLGVDQSCTVTVIVVGPATGSYNFISGSLTSNFGNSGTAAADLDVLGDRPGFTKSFSPNPVALGQRSTLTFTIDNALNDTAASVEFIDNLPVGMVVADPSNLTVECGSVDLVTAPPGAASINASNVSVASGATCTISVDVVSQSSGPNYNLTEEGTANVFISSRSMGKAGAVLNVDQPNAIHLIKEFIGDPKAPGDEVTIAYTMWNTDRNFAATNVSFTDDLDAALSGLVMSSSPFTDPCSGVSVSGSGVVSVTGGTIASGASCTFEITATIPSLASEGVYPSPTNPITADIDGMMVTGNVASDDLTLKYVPILTKTFLDNPVKGGDTLRIEYTITNPSPDTTMTGITFTDEAAGWMTPNSLPDTGFCGVSASMFFTPPTQFDPGFYSLVNGELAPGASCTFEISVTVNSDAPNGTSSLPTSEPRALLGSNTVIGQPASDEITIVAPPSMSVAFNDPVRPGELVDITYTIQHSVGAPSAADDISFTHDLDATLTGLTAEVLPDVSACGVSASLTGSGLLTFTAGQLDPGASCSFVVQARVPADAVSNDYVSPVSDISATVSGTAVSQPVGSDTLTVLDVELILEITDGPAVPGGQANLRVTINNNSASQALSAGFFTSNLSTTLSGLVYNGGNLTDPCGAGSSLTGTTFLIFLNGNVAASSSCSFDLTLDVPASATPGLYSIATSLFSFTLGGSSVTGPQAIADLEIINPLIIEKSYSSSSVLPGGSVTVTYSITNLDASGSIDSIAFSDDLDAALSGLTALGLPASDICGAGSAVSGTGLVSFSGGTLAAGATCSFDVDIQIPAGAAPGTLINNPTSQVMGNYLGSIPVSGDPANAELIVSPISFSKSFDGPTAPTNTAVLTFSITNGGAIPLTEVTFTDDLDAVLPGLTATSFPADGFWGEDSSVSGASIIIASGITIAPGETCTFDVTVTVPDGASPNTYTNITSSIQARVGEGGGAITGSPASADLTVNPSPGFAKAFSPNPIATSAVSTLTFTIDNSASTISADSLDFTDTLPAGMVVANPANASTTCSSGTLTAVPGSGTITYSGGSVAPGATCTISVDVTAAVAGDFANTSGPLTSTSGTSSTASDSLRVNPPPGFAKTFGGDVIIGNTTTLTFTIDNSLSTATATLLDFTDSLPIGVIIANPANVSNTCGGTVTAVANSDTISFSGGSVSAMSVCTISVDVTGTIVGDQLNTSGDLTSSLGNSGVASDTLRVNPLPTFTKAFSPDVMEPDGVTTLTFTIDNTTSTQAVTGLAFTDTLPSDLVVASPANTNAACGGTFTAVEGTNALSLTGGSVPAGATCTISLDVTGSTSGTFTNTSSDLTTDFGTSAAASDDITVLSTADLSVSISDSVDPVTAGTNLTYTVTVDNGGPSEATDVSVATVLDPNTTLVSTSGCVEDPNGSGTCTLGTIAAAGSTSFSVTVAVDAGFDGTLSFEATVSSATQEGAAGDESATETTQTELVADLGINIIEPPVFNPGEEVTITVEVVNNGPSDATGASVNVSFPAELLNPNWTCAAPAGSACAGSGIGNIVETVNLLSGATLTFTITAMVQDGFVGDIDPTGSVSPPAGVTDDNPANDTSSGGSVSLSPAEVFGTIGASLESLLRADTIVVNDNQPVYLHVTLENTLPTDQLNDPASDEFIIVLPPELTLTGAVMLNGDGVGLVADLVSNTVTWNGVIPGNGFVDFEISAFLNPGIGGGEITVQGLINYDSDGDGVNDATRLTDDPNNPGAEQPTPIRIGVPTLGEWALIIFVMLMMAAAVSMRRRQSI